MFDWLFNKRGTPIVEVPTVKRAEPSVKLSILLILQMEKYIQQNRELVVTPTESIDDLITAYWDLSHAGLSNSKNARIIKQRIDAIKEYNENIKKAHDVLHFVKKLRTMFGEQCILMGTKQFWELCNKFRLSIGTLDQYTGVVPDKNIKELKFAQGVLNDLWMDLYSVGEDIPLWFINEIMPSYTIGENYEATVAKEWIRARHGLIMAKQNYDNEIVLAKVKDCNPDIPKILKDYEYPHLIRFGGHMVNKDLMLIACPASELKEQPLKITTRTIDPIIFQYTKYGVVIYTMWGEESEDEVMEEYKRLNNLINL
jgi:hypothetical protein